MSSTDSDGWQLSPSWKAALADELTQPYFAELQAFVDAERTQHTVLPAREDQFSALAACNFEDVRVVILGQDPYPTPGHAHGLAFSVLPNVRPLPGSLKNIYQELYDDLQIPPAEHGCLTSWADQGVLLLNSVLSVRAREPQSHAKQAGWETFTGAILRELASRRSQLVFLLWGKSAQDRGRIIDRSSHLVLEAPHPSPLSARRGFFGCGHFSQTNQYLEEAGSQPVAWQLPALGLGSSAGGSASAKTDQFETVEEKLAFRMQQGLFSVVDLDVSVNAEWASAKGLGGRAAACYAVKPGRGGNRYLNNIEERLILAGFSRDVASGLWLRPKSSGLINVKTLQPVGGPIKREVEMGQYGGAGTSGSGSAEAVDLDAIIDDLLPTPSLPSPPPPPAAASPPPPLITANTRYSPEDAAAVIAAVKSKRYAPLPMPPRLSPTAISAFKECPQLFLFRHLWKLPEPPSTVLTKGILVHTALERLFELPPTERSLTRLHDTLRDEWRVERAKPDNMRLFESIEEEREWGLQCLKLLDNYLEFEDPSSLPAGEPLATEAWLSASLGGGGRSSSSSGGVKLVGKVDRLDAITSDDGLVIVDYKTGKPPSQKYSETMNEKIRRDAFFQLRCYALLLVRGGPPKGFDGKRAAPIARKLRLLYLADEGSKDLLPGCATPLDDELPLDAASYGRMLDETEAEVLDVWQQITALVQNGDPLAFQHCNRKFCSCHDVRPLVFPTDPLFE